MLGGVSGLLHCYPAGTGVYFGYAVMICGGKYSGQIIGGEIEHPLMTSKGGDRDVALGEDGSVVFKNPFKIHPVQTDWSIKGIFKGNGYIIGTGGATIPT
mgnify:CR=1 FL=1